MAWNANGIGNTIHELREYIYLDQPDICIIVETKLSPSNRAKYNITGYQTLRQDRTGKKGGGIIIYVKNGINFHKFNLVTTDIESLSIRINHCNFIITIVALYNPNGSKLNTSELDKIFSLDARVVAIGDWNAKNKYWNCSTNNKAGNCLLKYISDKNLVYITRIATRYILIKQMLY